jgi:glycosyltransferase involved in cell wall biosynthesis
MKVAYVTTYDLQSPHLWPRRHQGLYGAGRKIADLLQTSGIRLELLGPLQRPRHPVTRLKWQLYRRRGYDFYSWADPIVQRDYAKQIHRKLATTEADIVLCPENAIPLARVKSERPLVLWTDALLGSLVNFYPYLSNLCQETQRNLYHLEQRVVERCDRIILTSDWAIESAQQLYGIDAAKFRVIPRGSSQETCLPEADIHRAIAARPETPCRLLFIGVDWYRKGGDIALEVARQLNQTGLATELHVVGCYPKLDGPVPDFVSSHGFIERTQPAGQATLTELFLGSHFLILPTRADTFGIVLSEANAFGLPCLATSVGGIPTLIRDRLNGKTFALDTKPNDYVKFVTEVMMNPDSYRALALSSLIEFQTRLCWKAAESRIHQYLEELVTGH